MYLNPCPDEKYSQNVEQCDGGECRKAFCKRAASWISSISLETLATFCQGGKLLKQNLCYLGSNLEYLLYTLDEESKAVLGN